MNGLWDHFINIDLYW